MKIEWRISQDDTERVKELLDEQADNPLVIARHKRNLADARRRVDRRDFWFYMTAARLTSLQRSGPSSHVARFTRVDPFPLRYEAMVAEADVESVIVKELQVFGGIRFVNRIASDLARNFRRLEDGEWDRALAECDRLVPVVSRDVEKEVADYIDTFNGFGPKQSRNLLQELGLTRFEIPIDSRVTEWLNDFGFPLRLSATALADRHYYDFVSDGIQALCAKCGVLPCILDAAIFGRKDSRDRTDNVLY